jgi:hypothetical protein
MSNLAFKLLDTSAFNLLLNTNLRNFSVVSEVLMFHNIPFDTWTPNNDMEISIIELSFTSDCKFTDVYLLAYILKDYGLDEVWATRKIDKSVSLGTYFFQSKSPELFALAEGMKIDHFLNIDPKIDIQYIIDNLFEKRNSYEIAKDKHDQQDHYDNADNYEQEDYDTSDHYDWERETFDAMTDGQLGDYDDFDGDIDDVMVWAGRD